MIKTALLFLCFSLSLLASESLTPVSLQLLWKHQFQFAGYYMAKEKGFYKEAGLDVKIREYEEGKDPVAMVEAGEVDFAIGRSSLLLHRSKNLRLLAAVYQSSPFVLLSLSRNDIADLKDIRGKKVAIYDSVTNMASIFAMLKAEGIQQYDFEVILQSDPESSVQDLIAGKIDFLSSYLSNEPYLLRENGYAVNIFNPKNYGFDFYSDILFTSQKYVRLHPITTEKFYRATLQGWRYAFNHLYETVSVIRKKYNTQHKTQEALLYEAKVLRKLAFVADVPFGDINPVRLREIANTYRLLGIDIDSANDFENMIYTPPGNYTLALEKSEKQYLNKKSEITVCIGENRLPVEGVVDETPTGMQNDFLQVISTMIDTPFTEVAYGSDGSMDTKSCDMAGLLFKKDSRAKNLLVTDPLVTLRLFIATSVDKPYVENISALGTKKVAVVKGYGYKELVQKRYANLEVVEVETPMQGFQGVVEGQYYGYIDLLPYLNAQIQNFYSGILKINGDLQVPVSLGFGVKKSEKALWRILQKAIHAIDAKEKDAIVQAWLFNDTQKQKDIRFLQKLLLFIGVVGLLVLYKYILSVRHNNALRASVKEFELLMESTLEGIIIFDMEGICIRTNKMANQIFGYEDKEMIGRHALELVSQRSLRHVKIAMQVKNKEPYEAKMLRKDGSEFDALVRGRNIFWKGKQIRISTVIDISDLKKLQYDLQMLNRQLEDKVSQQVESIRQKEQMLLHQNKLAAMGEMIGAIAHQWRQPLNVLNINIQNLDDDYEDGLIDRTFIENFIAENSRIIQFMSKTIDDFRNFYRIDKVKECFFVREAIELTTSMQSAQFKERKIDFEIRGDDFCITGYKHEFQQAILNLVNNAADAVERTGKRGKIEIVLENDTVRIIDNGGGIDEAIIDRIFEPYFTTKSQGSGTGIGLYMSKVIIEKNMGGRLDVQNGEEGAVFTISLKGLCKFDFPEQKRTRTASCITQNIAAVEAEAL